jgi:hypothetical protein|tara:strand:+ start:1546 stop:1902 length:357 start_codon:yes stop_codon:yes gene_type:complete
MNLTTQQLNKKLKDRVLKIEDQLYMKDTKIRVVRARQKTRTLNYPSTIGTLVTIEVQAMVKSTRNEWLPLTAYGPRAIRNFLRRDKMLKKEVSSWTRLWGFPTKVSLEKINLRTSMEG